METIFIAHHQGPLEDKIFGQIAKALAVHNIKAIVGYATAGRALWPAIQEMIVACPAMIVIATQNPKTPGRMYSGVLKEVIFARKKDRRLIPILGKRITTAPFGSVACIHHSPSRRDYLVELHEKLCVLKNDLGTRITVRITPEPDLEGRLDEVAECRVRVRRGGLKTETSAPIRKVDEYLLVDVQNWFEDAEVSLEIATSEDLWESSFEILKPRVTLARVKGSKRKGQP